MAEYLANNIRASLIGTPFLSLPQSVRTQSIYTFAQVVSETINLSHCKVSKNDLETENISATLDLGRLKVLATHGTAIDMQTVPRGKSCFIIPLETMAVIHVGKDKFILRQTQDIIYLPPMPWEIAVKSPLLSALAIVVETSAIHDFVTSHFGSGLQTKFFEEELNKPVSLSARTRFGASFLDSIHASLRFIESVIVQESGALTQPGMGDLLLHQLVFLWNKKLQRKEQDNKSTLDLNQLVDWIRQHCCEPICLADLEALSGYTSRNLQRAFQNRFGCGPMQYLRKERLNVARHKLETSPPGTRIMDIAQTCGYNSVSSFNRDFREAYQVTPTKRLGYLWRMKSTEEE